MKERDMSKYILKIALLSLVFAFFPSFVFGAQIYLLPQTGVIEEGKTIISELRLNTEGEQINAVDIEVTYPSEVLEVVDVIEGKSFIDLWVGKPTFRDGKIIIQGGKINGFSGEGLLLQIIFKGKTQGTGEVSFSPSSKVLLHDGSGTPVEGVFSGARYTIKDRSPEIISIFSSTHPISEEWFAKKLINISWQTEENYSYSYIIARDIPTNPDNEVDDSSGPLIFRNPSDGLYYFSIKKLLHGSEEWSPIVRYTLLQDKTPPEPFRILFGQNDNVYGGQNFVVFGTTDRTSGIDYYEIRKFGPIGFIFGKGKWKIVESPYPLGRHSLEGPLRDIIEVKAVDKAGNERIEKFVPRSIFVRGISIIIVIFILILLRRSFKRRLLKRR